MFVSSGLGISAVNFENFFENFFEKFFYDVVGDPKSRVRLIQRRHVFCI